MSRARIQASEATAHKERSVVVKGHAQVVRDLGNLVFVLLRDASGTVQVVLDDPSLIESTRPLSAEAPLEVAGTVVEGPKNGACEVRAEALQVLSAPAAALPVEIGKTAKVDALALSTMLDYRPLTLRNPKVRAIFKIEAAICRAFRRFLEGEGFTEIHSPKIVSTGTEGGAQLFRMDYFGKPAFLAQSPQFYKQIMVGVFERVFEVGPVYRAEEHDTTRHLNEYISLDFEMGFIKDEQEIIALQIRLMKEIFAHLKESCAEELKMYNATVPEIETIPQMKLDQARELLLSKLGWKAQSETQDLDPEGERLLCNYMLEKEGTDLLYLTHYPHKVRPFYAMPCANGSSLSFDLLFRGLEITTGGQRIHKYDQLVASMKERGLEPTSFEDYLLTFRHGMPPHGGLAIGLERLAKQLLGLPTVKLAALFPRDLNRLTP